MDDFKTTSPAKYDSLQLTKTSNEEQFKTALKAHQADKTDYPTFCKDAAKSGIENWSVCMVERTCTYYDKADNKILVEEIPQ